MSKYVNFKLKTGEDIIGVVTRETEEFIYVKDPLQILIHPMHGHFAKSWMMLSDLSEMKLIKSDCFWITPANRRAIWHYDEFMKELDTREPRGGDWDTVDDMNKDLEDMFESMALSKVSTKH